MDEYSVVIPVESYSIFQFTDEDMPGIVTVNTALREFEPKIVFSWHLSLIVDFQEIIDNGMPSEAERRLIDEFEIELDGHIKGTDPLKPNAIFLARITWNGTRQLIWRVYDPEPVNHLLQEIISTENHPRQFDFRIDPDREWELTEFYLRDYSRKD